MSFRASIDQLRTRALTGTHVHGLVAFRFLFGLVMAGGAIRFLANGWVERFFVTPTFFFPYWGLSWIQPLPAPLMHAAFWAMAIAGLFIAVGFLYRLSAVVFFVVFTYVELIDVTNYLNHYYLVSLIALLFCVLPLNSAGSIDAYLRPALRATSFPAWMTWLLRFQVGVVYFFAGMAKATGDWLLFAQPMSIWMGARTDVPLVGALLDEPGVAMAMSWAGFLFDTSVPFWLSWRRTRLPAYCVLLAFHASVGALFQIGMFPVIMCTAALVFFEPDWPLRMWSILRRAPERAPAPRSAHAPSAWAFRAGTAFVLCWALVQIAVPLRSFAYGGNVLWHEQGMRWSWRVMCREKNGSVTLRVRAAGWDHEREVSPRRYLTSDQEREMSAQPDMILALAHHIAREFEARGYDDVEVRADAWASLNGRPMARLIDPDVDLTRIHDDLAPATWILPAPEGPPVALRARTLVATGR